ncbi:MAG TPA: hypothetical protein VGM43_16575 [Bryobacteraceae bacterium]|jgi:hypothetical protein
MSKPTEVWSCGGGTQSGAIAVLVGDGKLPRPDICFMTDTGREKSGTWPFVNGFIRPQLARVGCELEVVKAESFGSISLFASDGETILLPGYTSYSGSLGKLQTWCSARWKTDICERYLRSRGVERARNWIGISVDEVRRVRKQHRPWLELWYPLIFQVRMSRAQCVELIRASGWLGPIPHSACKMCPNMRDDEWLDMQQNYPSDFAEACQIEAEVRQLDPHFWLHPACIPLASVDFTAQHTMFADRGCTTGCFT